MKYIRLFGFLLTLMILVSCGGSNENEGPDDLEAPKMDIGKPLDGAIFMTGEEVRISGVLTDDIALDSFTASLEYLVTKSNPGPWSPEQHTIYLDDIDDPKVHNMENVILFGETITAGSKAGDYKLNLTLQDKSGKETKKTITIKIQ